MTIETHQLFVDDKNIFARDAMGQVYTQRGEMVCRITSMQFAILEALMCEESSCITYERLAKTLYNEYTLSEKRALFAHLSELRRNLDLIDPGLSERIKTVRGVGYYWENNSILHNTQK